MPFNRYYDLPYNKYLQIVPDGSPLATFDAYNALVSTAKHYNADPRYILAFLKQEGNFSTASGASWQIAAHNPGGLLYAGQRGANPGPLNERGEPYAAFSSYGDFFDSMLSTLTGYDAWKQGNAYDVASVWTKGKPGVTDAGKLLIYQSYGGDLAPGTPKSKPIDFGKGPLGIPLPDIGGAVQSGVENALGAITGRIGKGIVNLITNILKSDLIERGALILTGFVLVFIGVSALAHAGEHASQAAGVAAKAAVAA